MKTTPLSEINTEDLIKEKKKISTITAMLIAMLSLLLILSLYNCITEGFTALVIIPFALAPIVISNLKKVKEINEELKLREQLQS